MLVLSFPSKVTRFPPSISVGKSILCSRVITRIVPAGHEKLLLLPARIAVYRFVPAPACTSLLQSVTVASANPCAEARRRHAKQIRRGMSEVAPCRRIPLRHIDTEPFIVIGI